MKTAISVPDALFHEVEKAARENHLSRSEVFVIAVREYLEKRRSEKLLDDLNAALAVAESEDEYSVRPGRSERPEITVRQGDIYRVDLGDPEGSEPGYRHPHVVVQNSVINTSRINTVVLFALTSNLKRAAVPGNVLVQKGEANLPKDSVVNVTQS